jgi:hypothetical protein
VVLVSCGFSFVTLFSTKEKVFSPSSLSPDANPWAVVLIRVVGMVEQHRPERSIGLIKRHEVYLKVFS